MAAGHLTRISCIQRLVFQTSLSSHTGQAFFPNMQPSRSVFVLPTKIASSTNVRALHTSNGLRVNECEHEQPKGQVDAKKPSGPQAMNPVSQNKSFSVLKYIKKSIPLSVKLDVPIGNFSTGTVKDVGKNLGNTSSSKTRLFEFFSLRELISTPSPFMLYGLGGLIPFSSVPIYMHLTSTYCPSLAHIQLVYGACILSFLGGVSWGYELFQPRSASFKSLGYSILLPLVSWVGVLIYPNIAAFPLLISGVVFAGFVDTHWLLYPSWFKNLRFLLTSLVVLSLFSTFVFSFTKTGVRQKADNHLDPAN